VLACHNTHLLWALLLLLLLHLLMELLELVFIQIRSQCLIVS